MDDQEIEKRLHQDPAAQFELRPRGASRVRIRGLTRSLVSRFWHYNEVHDGHSWGPVFEDRLGAFVSSRDIYHPDLPDGVAERAADVVEDLRKLGFTAQVMENPNDSQAGVWISIPDIMRILGHYKV